MPITQTNQLVKRRGRVVVTRELLFEVIRGDHDSLAGYNAVFQNFVIFGSDANLMDETVEFYGYHPQFDELEEGVEAPLYNVQITRSILEHGIVEFSVRYERSK